MVANETMRKKILIIASLSILMNEIQLIGAQHIKNQPYNFLSLVFSSPRRPLSNGAQTKRRKTFKMKKPYKLVQNRTDPRDDVISFDSIEWREIKILEERVDFWG